MKIELSSMISMAAILAACCANTPESSGVKDGKLAECPDKPNCVSSMAGDKSHYIEPFRYSGDFNKVKTALIETVKSQDWAVIVSDNENYIHAEFKSKIFRFTDDVEFLIDDKSKTVHIRSASRVGYSDMGVNRKRMESLRAVFNQKMK
jgi:uncharacterized protein (DUF1499 family)